MAINYDILEDELITRLEEIPGSNSTIILEKTPEDESDFNRVWKRPTISVFVQSESYQETVDTSIISQPTEIKIVVSVHTKKLRGSSGVRYLASLVKELLLGFRPSNYEKLTLETDVYDFQGNIWQSFITFNAVGHIVEVERPETLPDLAQITYETDDDSDWLIVPDTNNPDTL